MNYNTALVSRENLSMSSATSKHGKKRNGRRPSQDHNPQQNNANNTPQLQGAWKVNKRQKFNAGTNQNNKNMPVTTYASACKVGGADKNTKKRVMQQQAEPMDLDPIFPKLNQSDPVHARRIQQRRKTVAMGKNTLGYAAYVEQVPKHKRRIRSMDTPSTPDHTLDIPNRRWQGMIQAW